VRELAGYAKHFLNLEDRALITGLDTKLEVRIDMWNNADRCCVGVLPIRRLRQQMSQLVEIIALELESEE